MENEGGLMDKIKRNPKIWRLPSGDAVLFSEVRSVKVSHTLPSDPWAVIVRADSVFYKIPCPNLKEEAAKVRDKLVEEWVFWEASGEDRNDEGT